MPSHIFRLIVLLITAGVAFYAAKRYFTVDTFYQYGHYRGDSVAQIASDKPKFKTPAACEGCHAEQFTAWSAGVHNNVPAGKSVKCEVCHGPAGERTISNPFTASAIGPDHPQGLKMAVPSDSRKLCTLCHEQLVGRPAQQPQIVVADHAGTQQCTACHNPHSPLLGLVSVTAAAQPGDAAAGQTKAAACGGCHGSEGVGTGLPGPTLAGQNEAYFIAALKSYATGGRDSPMMTAMAQAASDSDAANLAAHFSAAKCESALDAQKQAAAPGRETAAKCVACHGADGRSGNRAWPNLIGQSKAYLVAALTAYRDGSRKNALMAGVVKGLNEADLDAAATYYAGASCKSRSAAK